MSDIGSLLSRGLESFNEVGYSVVHANVLKLFGIESAHFSLVTAFLLFGSIWFMLKLKFINFTQFIHSIRIMLKSGGHSDTTEQKKEGETHNDISPLKALLSTIAGAAGLGNIAGVAVAVSVGGPGSAFWMIVTPFLTMPLRFAEVCLGHKYREKKSDGSYFGGPAYYMREGISQIGFPKIAKMLALIYAVSLLISGFGGGNSFQSNQAVQVLVQNFDLLQGREIMMSLIFTAVASVIIFGGVARMANFLSAVIPVIIGVYFFASLVVIITNHTFFADSMKLIFSSAFDLKSISGGMLGAFIVGFNRIIIANETGLGTAPTMHCNSNNNNSAKEGLISMAAPVIDTLFVCFMSAMVVIVTQMYNQGFTGIIMTTKAFSTVNSWFPYIIIFMVPLMALNVVIAWSLYGFKNCEYLFGAKISKVYKILYVLATFGGGVVSNFDIIVKFTDIVNLASAIPNVIAVVMLTKIVQKEYKDYLVNKKI